VSTAGTPIPTLDLQDERLLEGQGLGGSLKLIRDRVRAGELGALPVILGLVVIAIVFQALNPVFLNSENLVNLLLECVPTGVIALGVVCVLLLGQIDLSVGSVSGLAAALVAVLFVNKGMPAGVAILLSVLVAIGIGLLYSVIFIRLGVPSFVITLGGLLAFQGMQLWLLGKKGAINLPFDSGLVKFAQLDFVSKPLSYVFVLLAAVGLFASGFQRARQRRAAGLSGASVRALVVRSVVLLVILGVAVWYLNQDRGVGWMFMFFIALVLVMNYVFTRMQFGRSMFAVGGNVEAARRAGINVKRIYTASFVLCTSFAAIGGILGAARLAAANQQSGGGDVNLNAIAAAVIGGTSLFGGRGSALSALLGILVISSISNGLTLLDLDSSYRFMITGAVLLLAVAVDSVARMSRASSGLA
jgi:simple sugar transport system permease protein/D-xylose transport system permease protein